MPKLLQMDSCLGILSTGKITESVAELAMQKGWECYILHGARSIGPTKQKHYQVSSLLEVYMHFAKSLLFDAHGLGSKLATKRILKIIDDIQPDIIQLHCIHGYYINYKILFEYLNRHNIPIVWTFHDCWAFTGHCAHFVTANCNKWKAEGCNKCPLLKGYPRALIDRSKRNYLLKRKLFTGNKNLHIVAVSEWLASFAKESFLKGMNISVINNGIDIMTMSPSGNKSNGKFKILGVASVWTKDKGLYDFYKLRGLLPEKYFEICLVGLSQKQISDLPDGINGLPRTESAKALAKIYSESDVFVNPTYADSFPTVNMEALACGTPIITYRTGGSPEIIDEKTGVVVDQGDVCAIKNTILKMEKYPLSSEDCRNRAVQYFNKEDRFKDYISLYERLLNNTHID